ncbi:MAG: AraC family transcriptional regulator [Bacteroidia bacterium]
MKAKLENIASEKGASSFYAYRYQVSHFAFKWHYHPEYELTYIIKGSGYRIVGNSHEFFSEGDLVLLGSNLPHTWTSKAVAGESAEAIVIQFSKEFISSFLELQEFQAIRKMLESASRGIVFKANELLVQQLIQVTETKGIDRLLKLIAILEACSKKQKRFITQHSFHSIVSKKSEKRMNQVCVFIQNHFADKISLQTVAELIHMSESNFCKFFKKSTGKTYSDYLNEIRINEAARLLLQTEKNINQISYECGFETLSYFNRVFLSKKGVRPREWRRGG